MRHLLYILFLNSLCIHAEISNNEVNDTLSQREKLYNFSGNYLLRDLHEFYLANSHIKLSDPRARSYFVQRTVTQLTNERVVGSSLNTYHSRRLEYDQGFEARVINDELTQSGIELLSLVPLVKKNLDLYAKKNLRAQYPVTPINKDIPNFTYPLAFVINLNQPIPFRGTNNKYVTQTYNKLLVKVNSDIVGHLPKDVIDKKIESKLPQLALSLTLAEQDLKKLINQSSDNPQSQEALKKLQADIEAKKKALAEIKAAEITLDFFPPDYTTQTVEALEGFAKENYRDRYNWLLDYYEYCKTALSMKTLDHTNKNEGLPGLDKALDSRNVGIANFMTKEIVPLLEEHRKIVLSQHEFYSGLLDWLKENKEGARLSDLIMAEADTIRVDKQQLRASLLRRMAERIKEGTLEVDELASMTDTLDKQMPEIAKNLYDVLKARTGAN